MDLQIAGKCGECKKEKDEFVSVMFITGQVVTVCMDCYAEIVNEDNDKGTGATRD